MIKVADFGLAENIYTKNYYRRRKSDTSEKLPVRWMSPESIQDGMFTEKSDVVREYVWTTYISNTCIFADLDNEVVVKKIHISPYH